MLQQWKTRVPGKETRQLLVGISGKLGAGKDTLALMLENEAKQRGLLVKRYAFADRLKYVTSLLTYTELSLHYTREGKSFCPYSSLAQCLPGEALPWQSVQEALQVRFLFCVCIAKVSTLFVYIGGGCCDARL